MITPFADLFALFFPPVCPACGNPLPPGGRFLCTACRLDAPLTGYEKERDNPLWRKFWGIIPVEEACGFLFYIMEGNYRRVVHGFKYRGSWHDALEMGRWFGHALRESGRYETVDLIVPVPLHLFKRLRRGYNQSEYLAEGLAKELERPVETKSVIRRVHNPSQARKPKEERWENVRDIFAVRHPERLKGRHILLVDDVFTTGATITSCAVAILKAVPDCRISVAVHWDSQQEIGIKQ